MKANELMIGDWVFCYGDPKKINILTNANIIGVEGTEGIITPIKLTKEILKMNGFNNSLLPKFDKVFEYQLSNKTFRISMSLEIPFIMSMGYIDCKYVHELQHALRLYGLNELADNFKIE